MNIRGIIKLAFLTIIALSCYKVFAFFEEEKKFFDFENCEKNVRLIDNGLSFGIITNSATVQNFLKENNIPLKEKDQVIPSLDTKIYHGSNIEIRRAVKITIEVDGKKLESETLASSIEEALWENEIKLERLDKVSPDKKRRPTKNEKIVVTRIEEEEISVLEDIAFKTTVKNDSKLGWREKKIETTGEKGVKEVKYKITYKNGKEISKVVLSKEITKEPVTQVETQGTLVKTGKSHKGQGTWYAFKGGLFAASPWLPMGSYAKVTNTGNGKSVIVQINDRGPFGPGRIIDLDKVAWQKIAALGAGVIGVKVEEVLN
jgi:hypothetical protein